MHSVTTLLDTPVQSIVLQNNSSAIKSIFNIHFMLTLLEIELHIYFWGSVKGGVVQDYIILRSHQ